MREPGRGDLSSLAILSTRDSRDSIFLFQDGNCEGILRPLEERHGFFQTRALLGFAMAVSERVTCPVLASLK